MLDQPTPDGVAAGWEHWLAIADRLETRQMPPEDADAFPTDAQRAEAVSWIRAAFDSYDAQHAGEPGRVTVRRLTSAEYAYAIRDLTGIDIKVGVDASSDAVGGEGFANFGDVQFVQDASVERYLEAAKQVADHAVIGAGPLDFYADPGKTGLELSALNRIEQLYTTRGFRVVSGEGGRPFGFDRYGKALYAAWRYRHRAALGEPTATLRALAAREGITGPVRRAHLGRRQQAGHWLPVAAHDRSLAGAASARRRYGRGRRRRRAQRVRRDREVARHLAQLVLRARRPRGRRAGRRESARLRRHDARRDHEQGVRARAEPSLRTPRARAFLRRGPCICRSMPCIAAVPMRRS